MASISKVFRMIGLRSSLRNGICALNNTHSDVCVSGHNYHWRTAMQNAKSMCLRNISTSVPLFDETLLKIPALSPTMSAGIHTDKAMATSEGVRTKKLSSENSNQEISFAGEEEVEDDILYRRIQIEARCGDRAVLDSYEKFVSMSANYMDITLSRVWEPFRTIKRRTLLRSAFVKKKYRVQYEWRTYYRCLEFKYLTGSTADTFLEYIERNLPESVALKVVRERIETLPPHLVPPAQSSNQQL